MSSLPRLVLSGIAALGLMSCGLVDSDITDVNLKLPEKDFSVDTDDWKLNLDAEVPSIACPPADCAQAQDQFCQDGACTTSCDAGGHCAATVPVRIHNMFDLANEAPELQKLDSQAIISVTVERIAFRVDMNTFNTASPELHIYLAPQGVNDPADPEAVEVGVLAEVAAGQTGEVEIMLTNTGKAAMEEYMSDYRTPFEVIVAADATISAGQPVPAGAISGVVTVIAHAGIN